MAGLLARVMAAYLLYCR